MTIRIADKVYEPLSDLESYFMPFRQGLIGWNQSFQSPYGVKKMIYADWTASGRLYRPIEEKIMNVFGPFMANTHTESNISSSMMTWCYHHAKEIIKAHVNANEQDVLMMCGAGTTSAINKFQRILGLRIPEKLRHHIQLKEEDRPIIFITHMEHHSNHTSWLETIGEVVILPPDDYGKVSIESLEVLLEKYKYRKLKIGSFTACSNVTGIQTPIHKFAHVMHEHGGLCFVDFAASAPYIKINMHPSNPQEKLDAIFFSPHKFLGGPGSSGVLLIDSHLYENQIPDKPGGGTVTWTNPWGNHHYVKNIEEREDGGTPGILQGIRAALAIKVKEQMGIERILQREEEQLKLLLPGLKKIPSVHVLEGERMDRLGIVSFVIENIHYNLVVKLLNDQFGYQVRGGCSCAGTYGHYLLKITKETSKQITDKIDGGDLSTKPGWVRFSLHPTMTNQEITGFVHAIQTIIHHIDDWEKDYVYDSNTNDYYFIRHKRANMDALFRM